MISQISVDGYKCLRDLRLDTGNLNVFVGSNSSGKSSALQALLLLRQSANNDSVVDALHLGGPLYEGGTAQDVLHPDAEHRITLALIEHGVIANWIFFSDRNFEVESPNRVIPAISSCELPGMLSSRAAGFAYLNAERLGPRVMYDLPPDETPLSGAVGKHGEYTAAILARASNGQFLKEWSGVLREALIKAPIVFDNIDFGKDLNASEGRLDLVCNTMLSWILPGTEFIVEEHDRTDSATLRFVRASGFTNTQVRPTHIGFGLAYTLPIVTAAFSAGLGGLLIVENPEAHLHPFSQSRIGAFLAVMAGTGMQVFVETHSDHVVNGMRLALKHGFIASEDVYFNMFAVRGATDTATVKQIRPEQNGRIRNWPKGFFDQIENDLSRL